jgi:hypothetical protein
MQKQLKATRTRGANHSIRVWLHPCHVGRALESVVEMVWETETGRRLECPCRPSFAKTAVISGFTESLADPAQYQPAPTPTCLVGCPAPMVLYSSIVLNLASHVFGWIEDGVPCQNISDYKPGFYLHKNQFKDSIH